MRRRKEPLYRKVNTTAHGVHHDFGPEYRAKRSDTRSAPGTRMVSGKRRGLDYTPLFRFLLSRVGQAWRPTLDEAKSRLDQEAPIYWLVAKAPEDERPFVRIGESSFYSGLRVDEDGILRKVDGSFDESTMDPSCSCCTHTFNGKRFLRKYRSSTTITPNNPDPTA